MKWSYENIFRNKEKNEPRHVGRSSLIVSGVLTLFLLINALTQGRIDHQTKIGFIVIAVFTVFGIILMVTSPKQTKKRPAKKKWEDEWGDWG